MTSCTLLGMTLLAVPGAIVAGAALYHFFMKLFSIALQIKFDLGYIFVPVAASFAMIFFMQVIVPKHITIVQCDVGVKKQSIYNACLINRLLHRG